MTVTSDGKGQKLFQVSLTNIKFQKNGSVYFTAKMLAANNTKQIASADLLLPGITLICGPAGCVSK